MFFCFFVVVVVVVFCLFFCKYFILFFLCLFSNSDQKSSFFINQGHEHSVVQK